jgi:hypothetical protein
MRVTVVPEDRLIKCDEQQAKLDIWPFDDAEIHAIQWYGTEGEIEYAGRPKPQNLMFDDVSVVQPYVDALIAYINNQPS